MLTLSAQSTDCKMERSAVSGSENMTKSDWSGARAKNWKNVNIRLEASPRWVAECRTHVGDAGME